MKNRAFKTLFRALSGSRTSIKEYHHRHHLQALLGMCILVIFCWTVGSIWLISARRNERSVENIWENKAIATLHLPTEN